jgi:hypothetical protein
MAEQIINTIKPLLIEGIKQEINKHKNNFDAVENGIDNVFKEMDKQLKLIADPIVTGIKMLPFGDPKSKLEDFNTQIDQKIDGIDLSELQKIEGLPEEIKTRVASIPDKVKEKLKASIKKIITGEYNSHDSSSTTTGASTITPDTSSSTTTGASTITPDTSSSTTKEIESSFSSLSTDQQNEARKEIIRTLINDKVFNNNEHIIEFINIIQKANVTPPESANAEQPQQAIESKVETGTNTSAAANTNMPPVPPSTDDTITPPVPPSTDNTNMPPVPPSTDDTITPPVPPSTDNTITPPVPPSTDDTITPSSTNGGAPKKQRRKTKKNIRRQLNKSTRFGRAF